MNFNLGSETHLNGLEGLGMLLQPSEEKKLKIQLLKNLSCEFGTIGKRK